MRTIRRPIKVVGIGGCGGNIINQLQIKKVFGVHCAAINTDSQALSSLIDGVECVQIGREITQGLGGRGRIPTWPPTAPKENLKGLKK